jgi:hypothetical protein
MKWRKPYLSRGKDWEYGHCHFIPTVTIGWGCLGFAIELRWLTLVITLYDHPYKHVKKEDA